MNNKNDKDKSLPHFTTDEEAQRFTDEADLSEYDLSGFEPINFVLEKKKDARFEMRISQTELDDLKNTAEQMNIPYTRLARTILLQGLRQFSSENDMRS